MNADTPLALSLETRQREEFLDITVRVRQALAKSGIESGLAVIFNPHTTAGLTINEGADPDVRRDILTTLARLIPFHGDYRHAEGNSDAHVKASLMGSSVTIPVEKGKLQLGAWQAIYFCEFDGPRSRTVFLRFISAH